MWLRVFTQPLLDFALSPRDTIQRRAIGGDLATPIEPHGENEMSIDPSALASLATYVPKLYEFDGDQNAEQPQEQRSSLAPPAADDLQALEQNFSDLIAGLTKQFAALEKTFMQAMRNVVKDARTAATPATGAPTGSPRPTKFAGAIAQAARRHELDPALLTAVVGQESGFRQRAISSAGAMGLMQLMPETARELGVRDPFDPAQNLDGGAKYLRGLIDRYHGRLDLALAAYNAGPGAVDRYGGVPPYRETQSYVSNILASYRTAALAS
jgi:soluble lytic murein transglycosylase-like protein